MARKNDPSLIKGYVPEELKNKPGVYCLVSESTEEVYVGSTVDLNRRCIQHLSGLTNGQHPNGNLQRAFDRDGFVTLEFCEHPGTGGDVVAELRSAEKAIIDILAPTGKMMNVSLDPTAAGPMVGISPDADTREKISKAMTGRYVSEETRQKRSQTLNEPGLKASRSRSLSVALTEYAVIINGVEYESAKVAGLETGLGADRVKYRCKSPHHPGYVRVCKRSTTPNCEETLT